MWDIQTPPKKSTFANEQVQPLQVVIINIRHFQNMKCSTLGVAFFGNLSVCPALRLCPATRCKTTNRLFLYWESLFLFISYPEVWAATRDVQFWRNTQRLLSKLQKAPPQSKIYVTIKSPVGDISVVTLIRTDTTFDHSQNAEKVCVYRLSLIPTWLYYRTKRL